MPYPCLVDPQRRLYQALRIRRMGLTDFFNLQGWRNYLRAFRRGARQGWMTGDPRQLPGVAVLDARAGVRFLHRGEALGDYPPLSEALDQLREVAQDRG